MRSRIRNLAITAPALCIAVTLPTTDGVARADELKRRGMIGVMLAPVPGAEGSETPGKGALVSSIVPDSAAAAAELQPNDIIIKIEGADVENVPAFTQSMRKFYGGDTVTFTVKRGEETIEKKVTLRARAKESSDKFDILYESVQAGPNRLRAYVTKPKSGGKFPAIVLVLPPQPQPVEFADPRLAGHPIKKLLDGMTEAGFVTMRVDRAGIGDSEGDATAPATLKSESEAFRAAAKALAKYDYVDAGRVYLLGYDAGAATAASAATGAKVGGVITFGCTAARPWAESLPERFRRIWALDMLKADEIDSRCKMLTEFIKVVEKPGAKASEALTKFEGLADALGQQGGIFGDMFLFFLPPTFFQELGGTDLAKLWSQVDAPVACIWGEADYQANKSDSEFVVKTINAAHPGRAELVTIKELDHNGNQAADQEESYLSGPSGGEFNPALVEALKDWIKRQKK